MTRSGIDAMLAEARAELRRLRPAEAAAARRDGAVLVDIRPELNRGIEGAIPGALVVERNVLEWRFDPSCDAALPCASFALHVVVFCNEGYTSSLAAVSLRRLGIANATDVVGGFRAWRAAGLPVVAAPPGASEPAAQSPDPAMRRSTR